MMFVVDSTPRLLPTSLALNSTTTTTTVLLRVTDTSVLESSMRPSLLPVVLLLLVTDPTTTAQRPGPLLVRVSAFLFCSLLVPLCWFCKCITGILSLRFSVLSIYHACCPGYMDVRLIIPLVPGSKSWRLGKMMRQ